MIKNAINKLILGQNLSEIDVKEVFDEILTGLSEPVNSSSFVTALKIKGETEDEIASAILASKEAVKKINLQFPKENLIENISMLNSSDYIDISFAMDLICAANSLGSVKYSFSFPFRENPSFKTARKIFDVNELNFNNDFFEKNCLSYLSIFNDEPYLKYTGEISRVLPFKNILNLTDIFLNPFDTKNLFFGVNDKNDVEKFARICLKLNYLNSIVLAGENNFPFVSIEGETFVAEAWKNKIFSYVLSPELLGIKQASIDEIKCENTEHNASILLDIFNGKIKDAKYDIIILNAALALYISKKADSIIDGLLLAKKTIDSGLALQKLEQIKSNFN